MSNSFEIKQELTENAKAERSWSRLSDCEFSIWTPNVNIDQSTVDYNFPTTPKSSREPPRSVWDALQDQLPLPLQLAPFNSAKKDIAIEDLIMSISRPAAIRFHPYNETASGMAKKVVKSTKVKTPEPLDQKLTVKTVEPVKSRKTKLTETVDKNSIVKPEVGWSSLVVLAIAANNNKYTTTLQIYEFIQKHFPYYQQSANRRNWQRSIRYELTKPNYIIKDSKTLSYRIVARKFAGQVKIVAKEIENCMIGINNLDSITKILNKY